LLNLPGWWRNTGVRYGCCVEWVGAYILALPETVQRQELWDAAAETLLEAAKSGHTARVALVFHLAAIMSGQNARLVRE
jgi:hypothetical protein